MEKYQDLVHSPSDRASNLWIILERLGVSNLQIHDSSSISSEANDQAQAPEEETNDSQGAENLNVEGDVIFDHGESSNSQEEEFDSEEEEDLPISDQDEALPSQEAPAPLRQSQRHKFPSKRYYNNKAVAHPIQAICTLAHFPSEH